MCVSNLDWIRSRSSIKYIKELKKREDSEDNIGHQKHT
jgi:hypothetical protein